MGFVMLGYGIWSYKNPLMNLARFYALVKCAGCARLDKKRDQLMDIIQVKDFPAFTGYTEAILAMDAWINTRPYFYIIKEHYLVDEAIRLEYIIIQ